MNTKRSDEVATGVLYTVSGIIVLTLAALLLYILVRETPHISWFFLTEPSKACQEGGGIEIRLFNSVYLLLITMIISFPTPLGAGIYLSEYAGENWLTDVTRTSIEILSSLLPVTIGLSGFLAFAIQFQYGFSIILGTLALTIFNLPLLARTVEEFSQAIHCIQREARLALGLSYWETAIRVVVPEVTPGILTGVVLSSGGISGEATVLIYAIGRSTPVLGFVNWSSLGISSSINIFRQAETLAVHIWKINTKGMMPGDVSTSINTSIASIIAILLFSFGARTINKRLYRKVTSV